MSRYHHLLATAVAGLADNTVDARRHLYDRARAAFLSGLANCVPPLSDAEVAYERAAFEQAVRTVEAEATGRAKLDTIPQDQVLNLKSSGVVDHSVAEAPRHKAASRRWTWFGRLSLAWLSGVVSTLTRLIEFSREFLWQSLAARLTRSPSRGDSPADAGF